MHISAFPGAMRSLFPAAVYLVLRPSMENKIPADSSPDSGGSGWQHASVSWLEGRPQAGEAQRVA